GPAGVAFVVGACVVVIGGAVVDGTGGTVVVGVAAGRVPAPRHAHNAKVKATTVTSRRTSAPQGDVDRPPEAAGRHAAIGPVHHLHGIRRAEEPPQLEGGRRAPVGRERRRVPQQLDRGALDRYDGERPAVDVPRPDV